MRSRDWTATAMRGNSVSISFAIGHRSLWMAILSSITMAALLLTSIQARAVPFDGEATVSGIIDDMWLDSDRCYFRVSVCWSDGGAFDGESVNAIASFLNESTDRYEVIPSSQGWRTGDEVNATLRYTYSEFGETYWIELTSKSDINYAEPLGYFERNPLVFYLLLIIALYAVLQSILILVLKRRGKRSKYEGPDYIQYRRRI
jgi:hypothetical protein